MLYQPYVQVEIPDHLEYHKAAHTLLKTQLERACKTVAERQAASRLWPEMLIPIFELPLHPFFETLRESSLSEKNQVLVKCKYIRSP